MSKGERIGLYIFVGIVILYFLQRSISSAALAQQAATTGAADSISASFGEDGIDIAGLF